MGNNLDLNKKIQYQTLQGHEFNFTIQDLKGQQNFPKPPTKEREIEKQFKSWLDKVQLDKKQKDQLSALPIKYKFRLCYRHDIKMKEFLIEDQKRMQILKDITQILEKLQKQINHINLQSLLNNLMIQDYMSLKVEQILQNNFVYQLVMTLQQLEITSRQSKNFRDQILIIRIFEQLLNNQLGVLAMCSVPQFFKIVFSAFHPIEPEICGLVLKVLGGKSGLCWQEGCEEKILDAMNDFKELYNLANRFEILIKVIYVSRNLVLIYHLIKFLFNFLFSLDNSNHVIEELYETMINGKRIDEIFKQIKLRIKRNQQYQIENCTYDSVRKNLMKFEHPLVNNNNSTDNLEFKGVNELNDESQFQSVTFIESEDHSFQNIVMDDRFYLESSDEQLFRGIGQQITELMDGILNIDNFNTLIEQQELEAIVEPQEFESNTFYMDQSINFSKQKSVDFSSHRIISQTNISNIDEQEHEIEIKLLEEKNLLIIKNYEEAQIQLESLKQELNQYKHLTDLNEIEYNNQVEQLSQLNTKLKLQEVELDSLKIELQQNKSQLEELLSQQQSNQIQFESIAIQTEQFQDEQYLEQQLLTDQQPEPQQEKITQETQTQQTEITNNDLQSEIQVQYQSFDQEIQVNLENEITQSDQSTQIQQQQYECSDSQTDIPLINVVEVQTEQFEITQNVVINPIQKTDNIDVQPQQEIQIKEYSDKSTLTDILPQQTVEQSAQTEPVQSSPQQINIIPPPPTFNVPLPPPPPPMKGAPPPPPMKGVSPPPPMNMKGVPPPPPMKGAPPPPPPMNGGQNPPNGLPIINLPATPVPSVAMKPLNWVVVQPQNLQNSIFKSLDGEQELDISFLEKNFNKVVIDPKERETKGSTVQIQKIQLISSEKQKNIELVLGKLKLPGTMIQKALIQIDYQILTPQTVDSLDAICPNEEDLKAVMEYNGAKELLGNAELFIDNLRQVNGFQFRLKSLKFLAQANENQKELEQKIEQLLQCFVRLQNLEEIKILFQITLNIGNFLNAKTPRGSALGFKIDVIEKCSDIKTQDNQNNLLCYIIQECEKKLQKDLITEEQIMKFEVSAKVSLNQLNSELSDFKKGVINLVKAIESQSSDQLDLVSEKFTSKLEEINKIIAYFEESLKQLEMEYVKCAQFYCENPKDSSDKFGEKLIKMFKVILKWKNDMKQKEERRKRQEEAAMKQQQKPQIAHPPKNPAQTSRVERPPEGKAVVNELMLQLQKRNNLQVNNKPSTFISNEINQLRQIKQQRGSFLQTQPIIK